MIKAGDRWVIPHYPDATIIGNSLHKYGYITELKRKKSDEIDNIEYYVISDLGVITYQSGKEWWDSLSLFQKFILHFII